METSRFIVIAVCVVPLNPRTDVMTPHVVNRASFPVQMTGIIVAQLFPVYADVHLQMPGLVHEPPLRQGLAHTAHGVSERNERKLNEFE